MQPFPRTRRPVLGAACAALLIVGTVTAAHAQGVPGIDKNKCLAGKTKCVNKKIAGLLKCRANCQKNPKKCGAAQTKCETKVMDKFGGGAKPAKGCFAKLEAKEKLSKPESVCTTTGDTTAMEAKADAVVADLVATLEGGSPPFVDNGDGTVTNKVTGLQWEQKVPGSGCPHCVNDTYTWTATILGTVPDGTAFTSFLTTLNGGVTGVGDCDSSDGTTISGGFAGHCDWRLPTSVELQTILLEPFPCGTSPCIDPIFGPTASWSYWSSTTYVTPTSAWGVFFNDGFVFNDFKLGDSHVRAVRGGS